MNGRWPAIYVIVIGSTWSSTAQPRARVSFVYRTRSAGCWLAQKAAWSFPIDLDRRGQIRFVGELLTASEE